MTTIASMGKKSTHNAKDETKFKEDLKRSIISLKEQEDIRLEEGMVKGKKYTYQEADEELLITGKHGRLIKPTRIINQVLVKNMVADQ